MAAKCDACEEDRVARMINGEVVTDSDSDKPDDFIGLHDVLSESGANLIAKCRTTIIQRAQREKAKAIAETKCLSRKVPTRMSRILQECPDIGKTIEKFIEERQVGAHVWRCTGVLTFDDNTCVKDKVT